MSSARMLDVMAMMGMFDRISRMHTVADTPSRWGMMMSIKTKSNWEEPLLILFTASSPSRYISYQQNSAREAGNRHTAISTPHSKAWRNLDPIVAHSLSSSTSKILGLLGPHTDSVGCFCLRPPPIVGKPSGNTSGIVSTGTIPRFGGNE